MKKNKQNPFCVTLIHFSSNEEIDFKKRFSYVDNSLRLSLRSEKKVSDAIYHDSVVHAIVFNYDGLKSITNEDENIIRAASKLGTCRIYLVVQSGSKQPYENSRLDDFIQRTSQNNSEAISVDIISFFREADELNRRSTLLAFRDGLCISAYNILKILWSVSYIAAALLFLFALATIMGLRIGQSLLSFEYLIPPLTFFGIFFVTHAIFTVLRNLLFGLHFARKFNFEFVIGVSGYLIAIVVATYSILIIEHNWVVLCLYLMLNIGLYILYMYARRIRAELTSISDLQTKMTEKEKQVNTLKNIGNEPFSPSSFPLFPFNGKTLFISYMHGSKWSSETAALSHKWASDNGYRVFLDRSTIPSGTLWRKYLLQSISESVFFVAIIDGDADATEWVLAESAYAAILRKNIGKPRILLVIKNIQKITQDKQNPFHLNYLDLFDMPNEYLNGARILSTDNNVLFVESFLKALKEIRPMYLLNRSSKPSNILYHKPNASKVIQAIHSPNDLHTIDKAWKTSALIVMLLTSDKFSIDSLKFLIEKCNIWLNSGSAEKEVVSLYSLNFLYKSKQLQYNKDLSDKILNLLLNNKSIAVKLAALDFLSVTSNTQNLKTLISETVMNQIVEFREVIKQLKTSQNEYTAKGIYTDIQREIAGKTYEIALKNVIIKVDSIHN
jgi:hypothetical protein